MYIPTQCCDTLQAAGVVVYMQLELLMSLSHMSCFEKVACRVLSTDNLYQPDAMDLGCYLQLVLQYLLSALD